MTTYLEQAIQQGLIDESFVSLTEQDQQELRDMVQQIYDKWLDQGIHRHCGKSHQEYGRWYQELIEIKMGRKELEQLYPNLNQWASREYTGARAPGGYYTFEFHIHEILEEEVYARITKNNNCTDDVIFEHDEWLVPYVQYNVLQEFVHVEEQIKLSEPINHGEDVHCDICGRYIYTYDY